MRKTLHDLFSIMGRLRDFRALFLASTLVIIIHQLALAGVGALSYWISSSIVVDIDYEITWLFAGLFTIAVVHALGYLMDAWWSHQLAYQVLASMRIDLYKVIQRIAPKGLKGRKIADVTAAGMNDMEQLEWFYAHTVAAALAALISPTILIIILYVLIGPWALLTLVSLFALVAAPALFATIQRRQGEKVRAGLAQLKSLGLESIIGIRELHVLGQKTKHANRVFKATTDVQNLKLHQAIRKSGETTLSSIVVTAVSITLLVVITGDVLNGTLNPAILPVAVSLAASSTIPVNTFAGMLGIMGEVSACAARVNDLMNAPDSIKTPTGNYTPLSTSLENYPKRDLDYNQVSFKYDTEDVLADINLNIPDGQTVAIVGQSGAGKTTLAYLAMRFYDPTSGHIDFAGLPLTGIYPDEYRQHLALVPQDGHVFVGTFRTNLTLAKWDASDNELWEAIDAAGMTTLVKDLGGLDSPIGDRGTSLSGGERQRLVLARAFLRSPELLILDEPLANIDPQLEQTINQASGALRTGRTTIVITHRLPSILTADTVIVVKDGRIHNRGTHEELLKDDFYRSLLANQLT
ncbi:ABC transporter ATP-binding protein [uncultured Mobiluncus sp.]|uniref:ABC transporter ATP-binding protein n=1 Tax=uncultured Mobiluncus sp. TaxID=293425 RepID=UPI0025D187D8|nr:ABC transporter ATP-binding protein [uncultured Mobiluncus sp.]